MALAEGGWGQAREEGAREGLRTLGFSSEPFGLEELVTRAGKAGGENTAGGFVPAAGLRTLLKMEGGMGVSGNAGLGCPGCYWVGEAGNRESRSRQLRERPPPEPQRSSPGAMAASTVRAGQGGLWDGLSVGRRRTHNWLGSWTGGWGSFLVSNSIAPSPIQRSSGSQRWARQAMSSWSCPGRGEVESLGDFQALGGLDWVRGGTCKVGRPRWQV